MCVFSITTGRKLNIWRVITVSGGRGLKLYALPLACSTHERGYLPSPGWPVSALPLSPFPLCFIHFMLYSPVWPSPCPALKPCLHVAPLAFCSHNLFFSYSLTLLGLRPMVSFLSRPQVPWVALVIVTQALPQCCPYSIRYWIAERVPRPRPLSWKQSG